MISMQGTVGDDEKVNDGNDGKKDDVKEDDEKVEDERKEDDEKVEDDVKENDEKVEDDEKMDDEAKVEDGEKMDGVAKVDDVKVDLKVKVKDLKVKVKDEKSVGVDVKEIDAFCHLLRKRISDYPKTYKNPHVAIGDCVLSNRIRREHRAFIKDPANYPVAEFKDYYMGAPHRYMSEWSTIDDVYMSVNINQRHWILCVARLQKYRIDVYDCDAYLYKNLDPYLKPFYDMIPHVRG
ncbi:ubiquitin-like protease 4 [Impatiens glandulifera]|uniref:ubiquitin-like protease 4 n=1 Tax=Impatiens glandulifera TaxID=253017 RepID=UPI001FB063C6|nr:ubiquitin-like protease 4 [Impatiens glandulifera]